MAAGLKPLRQLLTPGGLTNQKVKASVKIKPDFPKFKQAKAPKAAKAKVKIKVKGLVPLASLL
jgi:hypothetical protein